MRARIKEKNEVAKGTLLVTFDLLGGAAAVEVAPARRLRKTVTVVFCDLVGSTALGESTDPEAMGEVLAR